MPALAARVNREGLGGFEEMFEVGIGVEAEVEVEVKLATVVEFKLHVTGIWASSFKIWKLGPLRPCFLVEVGVI